MTKKGLNGIVEDIVKKTAKAHNMGDDLDSARSFVGVALRNLGDKIVAATNPPTDDAEVVSSKEVIVITPDLDAA